jgi:hypothetical protein
MKKIWILVLTCISVSIVVLSCSLDQDNPSQINTIELTRKDILAISHLQINHVIKEETLRSQLNDFLQENSKARSVNSTSSVITEVTEFSSKAVKRFSTSPKNTRSATNPEETEILFYLYNIQYVSGCVMTAAAQIIAFHEYPTRCSASGYTDIAYTWKDMKAQPYPYGLISNAQRSVAALMYELCLKAPNTKYGTIEEGGTSATFSTEIFSKMGYKTPSSSQSYNYATIKSSIDAKKPVAIIGDSHKQHHETKFLWWVVKSWDTYTNGHAWVIDGYRTRNSTMYVHCNLGWYNNCDGWYASGVFNTNNVPESTRAVGTNHYYAYDIKIIPNITRP